MSLSDNICVSNILGSEFDAKSHKFKKQQDKINTKNTVATPYIHIYVHIYCPHTYIYYYLPAHVGKLSEKMW